MHFFHYLFNSLPEKGNVKRIDSSTIRCTLPHPELGEESYELPVDFRVKRALIAIDGEPLWGSIPKAGEKVYETLVTRLSTEVAHVRKVDFGSPHYHVADGSSIATLDLKRYFFLLPSSISLYRLVRDKRSLGPMYVFARIVKRESGPVVSWIKSSY